MKFLVLMLLFSSMAIGDDLKYRPKSFATNSGTAVFVDFREAHYEISYDIPTKIAFIKADIEFYAPESGLPIFDIINEPTKVLIDGVSAEAPEVLTPEKESTVRVIQKHIQAGFHHMHIEAPLSLLLEFKSDSVHSAFWLGDMKTRRFLERYIPANFEFDHVKMTFTVEFIGGSKKQKIYANGEISPLSETKFQIRFPEHFTCSSVFFHTVPEDHTSEIQFNVKSLDGRELPILIYAPKNSPEGTPTFLQEMKEETLKVINELEADYGAFPHPSILIYTIPSGGGMEYCGATMTEKRVIGHELFHSYFARGVMPANGNSAWVDEGLATWRDKGYQKLARLNGTSSLSAWPYYTRNGDMNAYTFGELFMRYLDHKLESKGGLKPFMRYMLEKKMFKSFFVEEFIKEMSDFYQVPLEQDFKNYTYASPQIKTVDSHEHEFHKLTPEMLQNFL